MPGGRPTKYNKEFHPLLAESLARNGLTVDEIADKMDLARSTVALWMADKPEFSDAIKRGREGPDDQVEQSLYRRAIGYQYEAEKPMTVAMGNGLGSEVEIVKYTETLVPDVAAAFIWLKNRRPEKWRDKHEVKLTGGISVNLAPLDESL